MTLELLKILVQPVALERDEEGRIIGEKTGEVTPLYSLEQLIEYREAVERELASQQSERRENGAVIEEEPSIAAN